MKISIILPIIFFIFNLFNLTVLSIETIESYDIFNADDDTNEVLPESETTGSCADQLNIELHQRNCRYGKCEQIKNGTDFVCHCDNYISGERCDRTAPNPLDACTSNPCWGDSLCITLESQTHHFKCLCPSFRRGKYCHIKVLDQNNPDEYEDNSEDELVSTTIIPSTTEVYNNTEYNSTLIVLLTSTTNDNLGTTTFYQTTTSPLNETFNSTISTTNDYNKTLLNSTIFNNLSTNTIENNIATTFSTTVTTTQIINTTRTLNTYIPMSEYQEKCNFHTCQLGKCLKNETCECIKPAYGKFCDKIDECLILNCSHGKCSTGKGCVCEPGFTGTFCEIQIIRSSSLTSTTSTTSTTTSTTSTTSSTSTLKPKTTSTTTTTETTTTTSSATKLITISSKKLTKITTPNVRLHEEPTTHFISSCENGGLLIDNVCICLNQYTGLRCEIPPTFSESSSTMLLTKEPELSSIDGEMVTVKQEPVSEKIISTSQGVENTTEFVKKDDESQNKPSQTNTNSADNEEYIPIFTISRYNTRNRNISMPRSVYWPWLECFPGDSKIYSINKITKMIEVKQMSELELDDQVLVLDENEKSLRLSRIVSFLHRIEKIDANFIKIYYETNSTDKQNELTSFIQMTPKHLIYVKKEFDETNGFNYEPAYRVKPGDKLKYYDYKQNLYKIVNVIKVETVSLKKSGIYSPLTESGTLIVDNILVSCYSIVKSHRIAQFFFEILNELNNFFELTSQSYLTYSQILYQIIESLKLSNLFLNVNI